MRNLLPLSFGDCTATPPHNVLSSNDEDMKSSLMEGFETNIPALPLPDGSTKV